MKNQRGLASKTGSLAELNKFTTIIITITTKQKALKGVKYRTVLTENLLDAE